MPDPIRALSLRISQLERQIERQENKPRLATVTATNVFNNTDTLSAQLADGTVIEDVPIVGDWAPIIDESVWLLNFDRQKWIALGQEQSSGDIIPLTQIIVHPSSKSVNAGQSVIFNVTAVGQGLNYTWEQYAVGATTDAVLLESGDALLLEDGGVLLLEQSDSSSWQAIGSNQASYTISSAQLSDDNKLIRVTVSGDNNPPGGPVVSNVATLSVGSVSTGRAVVVTQPTDQSVIEGNTAVFAIATNGMVRYNLYDGGGLILQETTTAQNVAHLHNLAELSDSGTQYRWGIFGTDNVEVFSNWATLTVTADSAGQLLVTDTEIS